MQANPPEPSNPDVNVEHVDAFEAFVGAFPGWNSVKSITEHASELYHVLGEKGEEVESDFFYSVGYDSPFRLLDRHNEVRLGAPLECTDEATLPLCHMVNLAVMLRGHCWGKAARSASCLAVCDASMCKR